MTEAIACAVCGQTRDHQARGLCKPCYGKHRKRGDLERFPRSPTPTERWIALIDTSDPDACWPWPGPKPKKNGYGSGGDGLAHRAVYERMVGPIPDGYHIDHTCHNESGCPGGHSCPHRLCVNWNHLQPVPVGVNLLRSPHTLNSINVAKTQCPQGHPYDDANTTRRNGRRHCKQCARDRRRKRYAADLESSRRVGRAHAAQWRARRKAEREAGARQ